MKKTAFCLALILCLAQLFSCGGAGDSSKDGVALTDAFGNTVYLQKGARVVCCYGSFAECWLLSGGSLIGVTSDAVDEGRLGGEQIEIVGSVKEIDLEKLVSLAPDYVILSADLAAHIKLKESFSSLSIPHGFFRVDTFDDYSALMRSFCAVNERPELYEKNVLEVRARIDEIKSKIPKENGKSVLLMRAYSSGIKAKTDDNLAGVILKEFGLSNIASEVPSLLENMSVEHIVARDPDYIFVLTMGSAAGAAAYLKDNIENNPAWSGLTAVKNGNYKVLPKELFHYKPNEKWAESYEYLAKIIFPDIFR